MFGACSDRNSRPGWCMITVSNWYSWSISGGEAVTTTADRVKHLLAVRGDSLRSAAEKTRVPKSTLQRITEGSEAHLDKWIPLIANAYGVAAASLMGGQCPKSDFEWTIRRMTIFERFQAVTATEQTRVWDTLQYLFKMYPDRCSEVQVAAIASLGREQLREILTRWDRIPPDLVTTRAIADGIHQLTGICRSWFAYGMLDDEPGPAYLSSLWPKAAFRPNRVKEGHSALTKQVIEITRRRLG